MQVSMSTGCLHHLSPDAMSDIAVEAGFRHIEVLLNPDVMKDIKGMARALETHRLQATVTHAPFSLDGLLSSPTHQAEALDLGKLSLEAAGIVGAKALTIHPGSAAPRGSSKETAARYVEMARRNIDALQTMAAAQKIELLVENTSAYYLLGVKVSGQLGNDPAEMEAFVGPADAPLRRMTFDTSHASTLHRLPVEAFIQEMGGRIANLHLSDANAWIDHLPIGCGRINFKKVFEALRAIGFDGNATLELRPKHSTAATLRRNRVLVETELFRRNDEEAPFESISNSRTL